MPYEEDLHLGVSVQPRIQWMRVSVARGAGTVSAQYGRSWEVGAVLDTMGPDAAALAHYLGNDPDVHEPTVGYLYALEVSPERRGRGLGGVLLETAVGTLRGLGVGIVFLHGRPEVGSKLRALLSFYERHGFHRHEVRDGAVVLFRSLD